MKGFIRIFGLMLTLISGGCGSGEDDAQDAREFAQNVDHIDYQIKQFEVFSTLGSASADEVESRQMAVRAEAQDKIERIINGPSFVLVTNGKESPLKISSAGNIEHQKNFNEGGPSCQLTGFSKVSGNATSLKLSMDWELLIQMKGEKCDAAMLEQYFKFQNAELDAFNLKAVRALIDSADLPKDAQRRVHLHLKVSGESR